MESCLLNVTESIPNIALFPFEADLLKAAEISAASESHLWNGAEMFILVIYFLDTRSSPDNIVHENGALSFI